MSSLATDLVLETNNETFYTDALNSKIFWEPDSVGRIRYLDSMRCNKVTFKSMTDLQ